MFSSIWQDIKNAYERGNTITRLIFVNAVVFVSINLIRVFAWFGNNLNPSEGYTKFSETLQLSSSTTYILWHPWSLVTHMFFHVDFFHILFNMLWLSWFGRITGDLLGDRRMLPTYIFSGLLGALFFVVYANYTGHHGFAYGASASVMGIALAAAFIAPDYRLNLLLIGEVSLKYVVLAMLFLDIIALPGQMNVGGHIAHLGGAAFGGIFVTLLQRGYDLSAGFNRAQDWIMNLLSNRNKKKSNDRPKPRVVFKNTEENIRRNRDKSNSPNSVSQTMVDAILDKIKREGYSNLSAEEKETLMKASKK